MHRSLVPVQVEAHWFLIESRAIREILGAEPWLPIPRVAPELPGVLAWRGRALPIVDLAAVLGLGALAPRQSRPRTLIIEHEGSSVAVPVDDAREVLRVPSGAVRAAHAARLRYSECETDVGAEVMAILDITLAIRELTQSGSHGDQTSSD